MSEGASRELEGLIHGYLDETLAEPEAQRLRELLGADERNIDEFIRLVDLHGVLAGLRTDSEPESNAEQKIRANAARHEPGPIAPIAGLEERLKRRLQTAAVSKSPGARHVRIKGILKLISSLAAAAGFVILGNAFSPETGSLKTLRFAESDSRANDRISGEPVDTLSDGVAMRVVRANPPASRSDSGRSADRLQEPSRANLKEPDHHSGAEMPSGGGEALPKDPKGDEAGKETGTSDEAKPAEAAILKGPSETPEGGFKRPPPWLPSAEDKVQIATAAAATMTPVNEFEARPPQETRKIVRNAEATIEVDSYEAAYAKLVEIVAAEKGYVSDGDIQKMPNGKIQASVTVRLPAERFDAMLARLKELGSLKYQYIKSEDVTKDYFDHQARLKSKEMLLERLKTLLKEAKGTAKELMEVEVQIGTAQEAIDKITGELRYYNTAVSMSTITLGIVEKDLKQPSEFIETLQANIGLTAYDVDTAYALAQKEIAGVGGQVVDSKMNRRSDGSAAGKIRARVDAEKFPALREALKKLGQVIDDAVDQQKTAQGGQEGAPKADVRLKKEQAVIDLSITTPPLVVTRRARIVIESEDVGTAYPAARKTVNAAGGKVTSGSLTGRDKDAQASLTAQIDAEKFVSLVDVLKAVGKVKESTLRHDLPVESPEGAPALFRERSEIELILVPPPQLIDDEHGLGKTVRDTFASSWKGILWSIEKLFVGVSLASPWLIIAGAGWIVWRRLRKKKTAPA
jgi:hypothetical protein